MTPRDLSERLVARTVEHLEGLVERHLPGFSVSRVFAGHPVGPDVRADLAFTLGLLHACGVEQVAGTDVADAVRTTLAPIDGRATHTFFSYRVAETLARWGPIDDNAIVASLEPGERAAVVEACDSSEWIELLDSGLLPANYAAVLARCEAAREALGIPTDPGVLDELVERVRDLMARNPAGYLDDSPDGEGRRHDIYLADIHLFTEPLADRLGSPWVEGTRTVLALVEQIATRDGSAFCWGRSTGALSACLTIELGALAVADERALTHEPGRWLALAANATERLDRWFDRGLTTAHQHRSPYGYRGPERRLQMSLDCLGKLAYAARALQGAPADVEAWPTDDAFADRDVFVPFRDDRSAGVWAFRSHDLAFDLPVVGPTRSDYLATPANPGLFEVPVDSPLVTGVPFVVAGDVRYAGGGPATSVEHEPGRLVLTYDGFPEVDTSASQGRRLAGERRVELRVDGRTLHRHERLRFERPPDSVSLQVVEAEGRPLAVELSSSRPHRVDTIDVSGLKEYRSFWGELPRVHQIDVDPATEVDLDVAVRPLLRVATNAAHHHYHRSLYDRLAGEVVERSMVSPPLDDPARARERLRHVDVFHLHWPEWFVPPEPEAAAAFCELLDASEVRLVWTQHNLEPHSKDERHHAVYQVFAEHVDLAIHHSEWGRDRMLATYRFREGARHVVIPHGHFGELMPEVDDFDRGEVEHELGLEPCAIRIGIVGAPRAEKQTQQFMETFAHVDRDDLQLLVLSLDEDETGPDDPRIVALPYEFVDRTTYNRRLAAIDVLALPFDPDGSMLTTGVVADVIGLGRPAIASTWGYLTETLGDAALVYDDHEALADLLAHLDAAALARAAEASAARQDATSWARAAQLTLDALLELGTRKL